MTDQPEYQFTELRLDTPYNTICAAISILQTHILAQDSTLNAESMFGVNHMKLPTLEVALALLVPVMDQVERDSWAK